MEPAEWTALGDYIERIGAQKVSELLGLEKETEGWEDLGVKDAVHSYRKPTASGLYYIKGVGDLAFPGLSIYRLIQDLSYKKHWDPMFLTGRVVHAYSPDKRVLYEQFSAPWPVTNRDFLYATYASLSPDLIVSVGFSVEANMQQVKGMVRGDMAIGGFVFRTLGNGLTRVTYLLLIDPKGSVPQMVVNSTQKKQAQNVGNIRAFLTQMGGFLPQPS